VGACELPTLQVEGISVLPVVMGLALDRLHHKGRICGVAEKNSAWLGDLRPAHVAPWNVESVARLRTLLGKVMHLCRV
jgi:hypothetical protein